ncbi:MAG: hypothetical protein LC109_03725 [Bacteroidia bacterium]|nr:hypothetical protein [Bacteroidia bacterium]
MNREIVYLTTGQTYSRLLNNRQNTTIQMTLLVFPDTRDNLPKNMSHFLE